MITGKLTGDSALVQSTNLFSSRMMERLRVVVERLAIKFTASVKQDKLSGQVLKVRSGRLRRSITYKLVNSLTTSKAIVGTNVEYGRAWEYGFSGVVNVRAYLRQSKTGEPANVRAHTRNVNMPERSFLRSTLRDMKAEILGGMRNAVSGKVQA